MTAPEPRPELPIEIEEVLVYLVSEARAVGVMLSNGSRALAGEKEKLAETEARVRSIILQHVAASPLPEERLAELQKALDEIIPRNFSLLLDTFDDDDWTDAHAALLALFDRQREETGRALILADHLGLHYAELRKEFDKQREEYTCANQDCGWYRTTANLREQVASLSSQLERLKAEQPVITREDVQLLRDSANVFNPDISDVGDRLEDLADRLDVKL